MVKIRNWRKVSDDAYSHNDGRKIYIRAIVYRATWKKRYFVYMYTPHVTSKGKIRIRSNKVISGAYSNRKSAFDLMLKVMKRTA